MQQAERAIPCIDRVPATAYIAAMAVREIHSCRTGLRVSEPVKKIDGVRKLIEDMFETARCARHRLAAVQIGTTKRVVTLDPPRRCLKNPQVLINPRCLVVRRARITRRLPYPETYGEAERPAQVKVNT
jgi:peptide deformylase